MLLHSEDRARTAVAGRRLGGAQELRIRGGRGRIVGSRPALRNPVSSHRSPAARFGGHCVVRRDARGLLSSRARRVRHRLHVLRLGRRIRRSDHCAILGPCSAQLRYRERAAAVPGSHGRGRARRARRPTAFESVVSAARSVELVADRDGLAARDAAASRPQRTCGAVTVPPSGVRDRCTDGAGAGRTLARPERSLSAIAGRAGSRVELRQLDGRVHPDPVRARRYQAAANRRPEPRQEGIDRRVLRQLLFRCERREPPVAGAARRARVPVARHPAWDPRCARHCVDRLRPDRVPARVQHRSRREILREQRRLLDHEHGSPCPLPAAAGRPSVRGQDHRRRVFLALRRRPAGGRDLRRSQMVALRHTRFRAAQRAACHTLDRGRSENRRPFGYRFELRPNQMAPVTGRRVLHGVCPRRVRPAHLGPCRAAVVVR